MLRLGLGGGGLGGGRGVVGGGVAVLHHEDRLLGELIGHGGGCGVGVEVGGSGHVVKLPERPKDHHVRWMIKHVDNFGDSPKLFKDPDVTRELEVLVS